jgi:hypothetical protein
VTTAHRGDLHSGYLASDVVLHHIPDLMRLVPPPDHWQWWAISGVSVATVALVGIHTSPGRLRALYLYGAHTAGAVEVDTTEHPSRTVHDAHGSLARVLGHVAPPGRRE